MYHTRVDGLCIRWRQESFLYVPPGELIPTTHLHDTGRHMTNTASLPIIQTIAECSMTEQWKDGASFYGLLKLHRHRVLWTSRLPSPGPG